VKDGNGKMSVLLREKLIGIQAGKNDGPEGWMHPVPNINF
jgi:hypothetical protein